MANETHIPHSLRIALFLLRIALGLNFAYLAWSALFNRSLELNLAGHSMSSLYVWLSTPNSLAWLPVVAAWALLIIGICLTLGLFTRLTSSLAIVILLASYLPMISFANFNVSQLVNDELIALFCLFVIIFGKAGTYLGVDKFLHYRR